MAELDDTLRTGQADVEVAFYTRQKGVLLKHKDGRGYKNALLQPMRAAFAVRKDSKELREVLDGVLKEMWTDGSLNKIKRELQTFKEKFYPAWAKRNFTSAPYSMPD